MSLPSLFTPEEVARKVRVERTTVYHWLSEGRLRGLRIGSTWRITEEDLLEFMRESARRKSPPKHEV